MRSSGGRTITAAGRTHSRFSPFACGRLLRTQEVDWRGAMAVCRRSSESIWLLRIDLRSAEGQSALTKTGVESTRRAAGRQASLWSATVSRSRFRGHSLSDKRSLTVCGQSARPSFARGSLYGKIGAEVDMKTATEDRRLLIAAGAKAVVCVLLVFVIGYSVVAEVTIDEGLVKLISTLLAVYFGVSARLSFLARKKG